MRCNLCLQCKTHKNPCVSVMVTPAIVLCNWPMNLFHSGVSAHLESKMSLNVAFLSLLALGTEKRPFLDWKSCEKLSFTIQKILQDHKSYWDATRTGYTCSTNYNNLLTFDNAIINLLQSFHSFSVLAAQHECLMHCLMVWSHEGFTLSTIKDHEYLDLAWVKQIKGIVGCFSNSIFRI
jgi:hypothetical protein